MILDDLRTSPREFAEQAVLRLPVHVPLVPCELLGTPKAFVAIGTDSPHLAVLVQAAVDLQVGVVDSCSCMHLESAGSVGTSLGYV